MLRRFLKRLQQRVERTGRQHVNFVDDVNLVAGRRRTIGNGINDFADIADTGPAGRVHFQDIHMTPLSDGDTMLTLSARIRRWAAVSVGANAIHALRDDPGRCRFPGATNASHNEGLGDPVCLERIL